MRPAELSPRANLPAAIRAALGSKWLQASVLCAPKPRAISIEAEVLRALYTDETTSAFTSEPPPQHGSK
jgi:hypothetical protein